MCLSVQDMLNTCRYLCRLLDNLKMPTRTSGFHICDILDLNDATAEGKQNAGGEGVPEPPHQLHHVGKYYCY